MRELKFRAFDTENKTWTFVTLDDLICGVCTENGDKPLSEAKQVWEQYTGLKDKNGKEIYEGDIVRVGGKWRLAVVYTCAFCAFELQNTDREECMDLRYEHMNRYEVIGNIHENTELLEEEE